MLSLILEWHLGSSHTLRLRGLHNPLLPGFTDTATVLASVYDKSSSVALAGVSWPVTLAHVAQSDGDYTAQLPATIVVTEGQRLSAIVIVTADGGTQRTFYADVIVVR